MKRPIIILFLSIITGVMAIGLLLAVATEMLGGDPTISINGTTTSIEDLDIKDALHLIYFWFICCLVFWGFWFKIAQSRYAIVFFVYILPMLYSIYTRELTAEIALSILGVVVSRWYLFSKENVVAYFESKYNQ